MTELIKPLLVGIISGIYYGIILYLCMGFSTASFILYNNRFFIPIVSTGVITMITFIGIGTAGVWLTPIEEYINRGRDIE